MSCENVLRAYCQILRPLSSWRQNAFESTEVLQFSRYAVYFDNAMFCMLDGEEIHCCSLREIRQGSWIALESLAGLV